MNGIYSFYVTTDQNVVDASLIPSVYDKLFLAPGVFVWVRTERAATPGITVEEAIASSQERPGEHYLGTVEL